MKINWFKIGSFFEIVLRNLLLTLNSSNKNINGIREKWWINSTYSSFLNFLRQGHWCKDCNINSDICGCRDSIDINGLISEKNIYEFIRYNMSIKFIRHFYHDYLSSREDENYKEVREKIKRFI